MNARTARIPWNHSSRSQGSSAGNLLPYRSAMITSFDDYPLHPGSRPINETNTADLNHYDRYFFNGYPAGGGLYFAAAMGLYPNRQVMDAAFCVVRGHRQTLPCQAAVMAGVSRRRDSSFHMRRMTRLASCRLWARRASRRVLPSLILRSM